MSTRATTRRRVTAEDVAVEAGCSASMVSLVLNGKDQGRGSALTRERVLAAAERLGYRIDGRGRSLATGQTGIVGYVAPDVANPFFATVQLGLLQALGPDLHLITVDTGLQRSVSDVDLKKLMALSPDGLVVSAVAPERLEALAPACPVILLDSPGRHSAYARINVDTNSSARTLADHLAGLGHQRIAYLDVANGSRSIVNRRRAFTTALRRRHDGAIIVVASTPVDVQRAQETVERSWKDWSLRGITAIVCGSDLQAFGAIGAARRLGLRIPQDLSVTGADDQPLSTIIEPSLTTVQIPAAELGIQAGRRMKLAVRAAEFPPNDLTELATTVVIRESTGPAPNDLLHVVDHD